MLAQLFYSETKLAECQHIWISCLTLQLEEVGAFLIHVGPLGLQDLVETLALKAAACHREVDKCNTGAQVWWELDLRTKSTANSNMQIIVSYGHRHGRNAVKHIPPLLTGVGRVFE